MGKLANPCAKNDIINRISTGESSSQIAKDYNVSGQRIRQIKKENKEHIEQKANELIKNLPDIVETAKLDIQSYKKLSKRIKKSGLKSISKEELQFKRITNKLSADILRSAGIFPSQSPSIILNQFNQDNSENFNVEPSIMKVFSSEFEKNMIDVDMNEPDNK